MNAFYTRYYHLYQSADDKLSWSS